jgi:succinate dehydrogenase hydrophobic anchor subunit
MKTISQQIADRRSERRSAIARRATAVTLVLSLCAILALVLGAAVVKAARIASEAQATAYCEGDVCGGPEW